MIAILASACLSYIWWGHWGDASIIVWVASALALVAAGLGAIVPADRARAHTAIAAGLMAILGGFAFTRVIGHWPFLWDAMPDRRYAGFITIACFALAIGLVRGAFWARWAAMAFAAGNALGGALNSYHMLTWRDEGSWLAAIGVIIGATILRALMRDSVRAHFARSSQHALWSSRDPLIRSARWSAIASFAAASMLLLYALAQPVAPRTVVSALVLAPILGIGGALVIARRTAGVVILALGGLALVAHTIASAEYVTAGNLPVVGYYAMFWMPAALLGIATGVIAIVRAQRSNASG